MILYLVRSTDHKAPRYVVFSTPLLSRPSYPLRSIFLSIILERPQPCTLSRLQNTKCLSAFSLCYDHAFAKSTLHYSHEGCCLPTQLDRGPKWVTFSSQSDGEGRTNLTNWEGEQPAALGQGNAWALIEIAFPLLKCSVSYNYTRREVMRQQYVLKPLGNRPPWITGEK